jgi:hypothetical protein
MRKRKAVAAYEHTPPIAYLLAAMPLQNPKPKRCMNQYYLHDAKGQPGPFALVQRLSMCPFNCHAVPIAIGISKHDCRNHLLKLRSSQSQKKPSSCCLSRLLGKPVEAIINQRANPIVMLSLSKYGCRNHKLELKKLTIQMKESSLDSWCHIEPCRDRLNKKPLLQNVLDYARTDKLSFIWIVSLKNYQSQIKTPCHAVPIAIGISKHD